MSAIRGGADVELRACVSDGLGFGGSTGAEGETSRQVWSESTAKRLGEAKREGAIVG